MRHKKIILIAIFALLTSLVSAQKKLILNLEGARKHALEYNKTLKGSGYAVDKAQMALWEAIANGLPQLSATMDYSNALGAKISIRFAENMPASEIDIKPQSNFYLNLNQLVFSGNYIVGVQMAKISKELSKVGYQKTELEIISQVTDAYHMVLIAKEMKHILELNLGNLKSLYDKTSALQQAGIIEQTDVDQLSVQVTSLQNAFASASRQEELAQNLLRLQLGTSIDTELELTENLDQLAEDARIEHLIIQKLQMDQNLDYRLMKMQELLIDKSVDMQRANALPTLSAFYRYTYKLIEPDFDMTPANMVGLQLNIPIFSSGLRTVQTKQAAIELKTTQNQRELLTDQLQLQEKQLRYNLLNALESYNNQKKSVEVSRRVYTSLKNKYEQGMISGLDLISADNNYLKAETDYITSLMEVLNARLQLEKLYGTIQ